MSSFLMFRQQVKVKDKESFILGALFFKHSPCLVLEASVYSQLIVMRMFCGFGIRQQQPSPALIAKWWCLHGGIFLYIFLYALGIFSVPSNNFKNRIVSQMAFKELCQDCLDLKKNQSVVCKGTLISLEQIREKHLTKKGQKYGLHFQDER